MREGPRRPSSSTKPHSAVGVAISVGLGVEFAPDRVVRLLHLRQPAPLIMAALFFPAGDPTLACSRPWPRSPPGSPCGRSARSSSGASATSSGASTRSWSRCCIMGGVDVRHRPAADVRTRSASLAPIILVVLRLLQGLALGGEYGGAAVYVAEHVPDNRRGFYTSFIQTTATLGLFVSLVVILIVQRIDVTGGLPERGAGASRSWLSILLVAISLYIRLRLQESPLFAAHEGEPDETSTAPIARELRHRGRTGRRILTVLFGAAAARPSSGTRASSTRCSGSRTESRGRRRRTIPTFVNVPATDANVIIAVALAAGHPVLHRLRRALRPHRPQADHDGRQPHRRSDDDPDLHR